MDTRRERERGRENGSPKGKRRETRRQRHEKRVSRPVSVATREKRGGEEERGKGQSFRHGAMRARHGGRGGEGQRGRAFPFSFAFAFFFSRRKESVVKEKKSARARALAPSVRAPVFPRRPPFARPARRYSERSATYLAFMVVFFMATAFMLLRCVCLVVDAVLGETEDFSPLREASERARTSERAIQRSRWARSWGDRWEGEQTGNAPLEERGGIALGPQAVSCANERLQRGFADRRFAFCGHLLCAGG